MLYKNSMFKTNQQRKETMNTYTIDNNKTSEKFEKQFKSMDDARHWVINTLDLSKEWNIFLLSEGDEKRKGKLHHTEYKKNYKNYILSTIEEDSEGKPIKTDEEKIKYIFDRFYSEYGWNIERVGKFKAMSEWLSGLALDIEYYNDAIVDLAVKMGSIDPNPSEKLKDKVAANYWNFMANVILGFEPKERKQ